MKTTPFQKLLIIASAVTGLLLVVNMGHLLGESLACHHVNNCPSLFQQYLPEQATLFGILCLCCLLFLLTIDGAKNRSKISR